MGVGGTYVIKTARDSRNRRGYLQDMYAQHPSLGHACKALHGQNFLGAGISIDPVHTPTENMIGISAKTNSKAEPVRI